MYKQYREIFGKFPFVEIFYTMTELKLLVVGTDPTTKKPLNRKHRDILDDFLHRLFSHDNTVYMPCADLCSSLVLNFTESSIDRFLSTMLCAERVMMVKNIFLYPDHKQFNVVLTTPSIQDNYGGEVWSLMNTAMRKQIIDLFLDENP